MTALRIFRTDQPMLRFNSVTGYDEEFAQFLKLRRERKEQSNER